MSISSTAVFNASHVLQFSFIFNNELCWMNSEFFNSREDAEEYAKKMLPFWESHQRVRNEGWRIVAA